MSNKRLFDIWAWSQVEAAADGSLDGESRQRMREAQERDPRLRAAIARARAVHGALRASGREPPPGGLLGALLAIPQHHRSAGRAAARGAAPRLQWAMASGAMAAVALAAIVVAGLSAPAVSVPPRVPDLVASDSPASPAVEPTAEEVAAAQEFAVALAYLNKSAAITGREVGGAINDGFTAALAVSRNSLSRRPD